MDKNSKLKVIGTFAFLQCRSLKKITIPKNLKKIDVGAFQGCKKLKKVLHYNNIDTPRSAGPPVPLPQKQTGTESQKPAAEKKLPV